MRVSLAPSDLRLQIDKQMYPFMGDLNNVVLDKPLKASFADYDEWMADKEAARAWTESEFDASSRARFSPHCLPRGGNHTDDGVMRMPWSCRGPGVLSLFIINSTRDRCNPLSIPSLVSHVTCHTAHVRDLHGVAARRLDRPGQDAGQARGRPSPGLPVDDRRGRRQRRLRHHAGQEVP